MVKLKFGSLGLEKSWLDKRPKGLVLFLPAAFALSRALEHVLGLLHARLFFSYTYWRTRALAWMYAHGCFVVLFSLVMLPNKKDRASAWVAV